VVVSRGELVEIGGAFRIPDVLAQSGAILKEVGTTNKTRVADYEAAITPNTGMLLKVHTSNYKVCGFTQEATLPELVELGRKHNLPVVYDLGSGLLWDREPIGGEREPTVPEVVAQGVDLVTFSGDKLLGGPQSGIVAGRKEAVAACRKNPIMRAMRPDKVTLAALEATLKLYRDPERAAKEIPALRMLQLGEVELKQRAERLAGSFREKLADVTLEIREESSEAGGGSLPMVTFPTWVVAVSLPSGGVSRIEQLLRAGDPPVVARVREDALLFDPRTLGVDEEQLVVDALARALAQSD
jgi:L-seryl-tRNA(Ser) seleniumtransferase